MAAQNRAVSFGEALPLFFKNYFNFQGRSSRGAYWWFFLISILISIAVTVIDMMISAGIVAEYGIGPFSGLFSLATLIPGLALTVRRLHDTNRSGWWIFIAIIPLIGAIVLLVFTILEGTAGANKYGPDDEAGRPPTSVANVFS